MRLRDAVRLVQAASLLSGGPSPQAAVFPA